MDLVPFDGDEMEAFWDEPTHEIRVGCKRLAENVGVDWKSQYDKLRADELFARHLTMVVITTDQGERECITLPLRFVSMWLATLQPGRLKPHLRQKALRYREQAADVLAQHFLGIAPRPEFGVEPQKSYNEIMAMFQAAAGSVTNIRQELGTKISAEEARAIVKEEIQTALKEQAAVTGVTPGKVTLLTYLDQTGLSEQRPQFWQDWVAYYDIASLLETPECVLRAGHRWPLRFYTPETHKKAFEEYRLSKKHEDNY